MLEYTAGMINPWMVIGLTFASLVIMLAMVPYLEQVSADPVRKFKFWITEDGKFGVSAGCEKAVGGCKEFKEAFGDNVNKVAKDSCEDGSAQKCKQAPKK